MSVLDSLKEVLAEGRTIRSVEEGIYSVLSATTHEHRYDRRATVYDLIVGTQLYNRVLWGSSPLEYSAFARRAVSSNPNGHFLDAGCGSLLFTAPIYLECRRRVIAFDQSLEMLKRARTRLIKSAGRMPEGVLLLQADLRDLPFRRASLHTILCMNVLHLCADAAAVVSNLSALLTAGGRLHLTSVVINDRFIGDRYLNLLYRSGEFARPRTSGELNNLLKGSLGPRLSCWTKGNMAYAVS